MSLHDGGVLGIALGTSTAGGYVTADGHITPWLNEIAFVPIDYRPDAPRDEWSGDLGCCVQYLSQQAVGRLLPAGAHRRVAEPAAPRAAQGAAGADGGAAIRAPRTSTRRWASTSATRSRTWRASTTSATCWCSGAGPAGPGGAVMLDVAREVLRADFPELAARVELHMPGEKEKRHGQAIAAASLPARELLQTHA